MSTVMCAVRCNGFGGKHQFVADQPIPCPGRGEVLIRVDLSGGCATDGAMYDGSSPWQLKFPMNQGQEFTGTVVDLGEDATERYGPKVGDRAVAELSGNHDNDFDRNRGLHHLSDKLDVFGAIFDGA